MLTLDDVDIKPQPSKHYSNRDKEAHNAGLMQSLSGIHTALFYQVRQWSNRNAYCIAPCITLRTSAEYSEVRWWTIDNHFRLVPTTQIPTLSFNTECTFDTRNVHVSAFTCFTPMKAYSAIGSQKPSCDYDHLKLGWIGTHVYIGPSIKNFKVQTSNWVDISDAYAQAFSAISQIRVFVTSIRLNSSQVDVLNHYACIVSRSWKQIQFQVNDMVYGMIHLFEQAQPCLYQRTEYRDSAQKRWV